MSNDKTNLSVVEGPATIDVDGHFLSVHAYVGANNDGGNSDTLRLSVTTKGTGQEMTISTEEDLSVNSEITEYMSIELVGAQEIADFMRAIECISKVLRGVET